MSILKDKINEKINQLKSSYSTNSNIKHPVVKGSFNENELSQLISEIIPKRYILTQGIIENAKDEQSSETDIIIYDNDILPSYIQNQNNLSFVPIEATKYIFEVKSKLNSKELKTTIQKFKKYQEMGGEAPSVLFSFSSDINSNELERYKKNDSLFFTTPAINVLCISDKTYCYKVTEEHFLKDYFTNEEWISMITKAVNLDLPSKIKEAETAIYSNLETQSRKEFVTSIMSLILLNESQKNINDYTINLNGIEFQKVTFKIHKWVQVSENENIDNLEVFSFLSGISNTLSEENFGNYLLSENGKEFKVVSICYEDFWGNVSAQDFNSNGLNYDINKMNFQYTSNGKNETHKITFNLTDK